MSSPQASEFILKLDSADATLERVGGKGASLARLAAAGLPVPPGFHITTLAYDRFVTENHLANAILARAARVRSDEPATLDAAAAEIRSLIVQGAIPAHIAASIVHWYGELGPDDPPVAVRSSATAEDLPGMSFAGQQETYLNVRGSENVLDAVKRCWASLWTARAIGYRARQGISSDNVSLAVVVQQLVAADVAGILFTANPLTGARGEMMINASWGLGEAIVGGLVTPDTLIVNKQTGALQSQVIANKEVMTVRLSEGTSEQPVPAGKRMKASLEWQQAAELTRFGIGIEQLFGAPVDIEWAIRDERIFILQARPITALPDAKTTFEWNLPRPKGSYWRSSVIELLPDPLSPLFATLGLPLWSDATRDLADALGMAEAYPEHLFVTINGYAYYDLNLKFRARSLLSIPRLIPRGIRLFRRARARWAEESLRYKAVIDRWSACDLHATAATELLAGAREIVKAAAAHYLAIQSGILPGSFMSEALFTKVYNGLIKRKSDPSALTLLLGFDSAPIQAERSLYEMAMWAREQPALADYLASATSEQIAAACQSPSAPIAAAEMWDSFTRRFAEHLARFGHSVYDLDFAKSVPADDPSPLLEALKYFLGGQARNPHVRQLAAIEAREQATQSLLARLRGPRLRLFKRLLQVAQRYVPLREDALADVGLGWPLLRRMLREVGCRLVQTGAVEQQDDVFWMKWDEVETAARLLDAGEAAEDYRRTVAERRSTWEHECTATPPVVLPVKGGGRLWGIDWGRWLPARTNQATGNTIKGIGASPGQVTGAARVIHGPGEFNQMRPLDILVAKITTPAWTPLFALASAIVTDVGGPLSHGSIVAREYHIPAVLGTGVATERIHSGQHITVDGELGVVTIRNNDFCP